MVSTAPTITRTKPLGRHETHQVVLAHPWDDRSAGGPWSGAQPVSYVHFLARLALPLGPSHGQPHTCAKILRSTIVTRFITVLKSNLGLWLICAASDPPTQAQECHQMDGSDPSGELLGRWHVPLEMDQFTPTPIISETQATGSHTRLLVAHTPRTRAARLCNPSGPPSGRSEHGSLEG